MEVLEGSFPAQIETGELVNIVALDTDESTGERIYLDGIPGKPESPLGKWKRGPGGRLVEFLTEQDRAIIARQQTEWEARLASEQEEAERRAEAGAETYYIPSFFERLRWGVK